jgi:8-oxo-dGTP diphosphatase
MLHRVKKKNDINHDKWIGIGGKFEYGESPYECIRREVMEEIGVTLPNLRYRGLVTFVADFCAPEYMHVFTADGYEGVLKDVCDEGNLEWVKKEKIQDLPIWQGDKIFLRLFDTEDRFFSLKLVYKGDELIDHTIEIS